MGKKEFRKTPKHNNQNRKNYYHVDEDVRKEVEIFLKTSGKEATLQLVNNLKNKGINDGYVKNIIKKAIYFDILKHHKNADKSKIYFSQMPEEFLESFSSDQFFSKYWKFVPYILKSYEYNKLITSFKNPIFIQGYNYDVPLYAFKNSYDFNGNSSSHKRKDGKVSLNDLRFYMNENDKIMFAKEVKTKYEPISLKIVKEKRRMLGEQADKVIYDSNAYERTLSISMYVLLDGNPNKAYTYFRYDSSNHSHNNLYIGNDKRKEVFGQIAESPHFHFQNVDDNLLCLKKFVGNDRYIKYKTGRCNAIDIPHLKKYLQELDKKDIEELNDELHKGLTYEMPFLEYKVKNKRIHLNYNKIIEKFTSELTEEQLEIFNDILNVFNLRSDASQNNRKNNFFDPLIKALDLLQYLHNYILISENDVNSLERKEILSNIEILFASNIVDGICRNSSKFLEKRYRPLYSIKSDYLTKIEQISSEENLEENNSEYTIKEDCKFSYIDNVDSKCEKIEQNDYDYKNYSQLKIEEVNHEN